MSKNVALQLPDDPQAQSAILTRWGQGLELRLLDLERKHAKAFKQLTDTQAAFAAYKLTHP